MEIDRRIQDFDALGQKLLKMDWTPAFVMARNRNGWFTKKNMQFALEGIAGWLNQESLRSWLSPYLSKCESLEPRNIGIICAGNIPFVGFHDILSTLITGHKALIKLSSKDDVLIPALLEVLMQINPSWKTKFEVINKLSHYDAVIATGSNNSALSFNSYFSHVPHIIRSNKRSIAIIDKDFSENELKNLASDIFTHFGLGCRNVSKILVHEKVDLTQLMESWHENNDIILHHKYKNNFDYNYTLALMNKEDVLINGALILRKSKSLHAPIASLNYEVFSSQDELEEMLKVDLDQLQCIISSKNINDFKTILPGQAQKPKLNDYADHIDTLNFLTFLS